MTKEEIEQAIEENLNSIGFNEDGEGIMPDGRVATEADFKTALVEHRRLQALLLETP